MKHTTAISIDYEVFIEAKKAYKNFSGRVEELLRADLEINPKQPKNLVEAQEMLKRHEIATAAIKSKVEKLEADRNKEKAELEKDKIIIGGEVGEE